MDKDSCCCVCGGETRLISTPPRCEYAGWGAHLCTCCCTACDYHACCAERLDHVTTGPPIPVTMWSQLDQLWEEFITDPSDWRKLDHLDLAMRVFLAKWSAYSESRRIAEASGAAQPMS